MELRKCNKGFHGLSIVQFDDIGSERRIKAIRKSDVLNGHEACRYIKSDNGLSADVYSLAISAI